MKIQSQPEPKSTIDVQDLYCRCCSDEPVVCNAAFQQLGQYLLRIAYSRMKGQMYPAHIAEDSTQQALITIWQKLRDGKGPDHVEWFLTWCASIVIHKVLDELRKLARSRTDSLEEYLQGESFSLPQLASSQAPAPDIYTIEAEGKSEFVKLVQNHPRLSTEAKFVLLYGYLLELDDAELARQLGKTRSTVRVLRFRGLHALRNDREFMTQVTSLTLAEPV